MTYIVDRVTDLDRLHEHKQEELGAICTRLGKFRRDLIAVLTDPGTLRGRAKGSAHRR